MKALVYTGPNALILEDVPVPVPGADEVLVRVEAVGICGSDMHAYHGHDARRPAPLILGHEAAGRVAAGPRAGARVAVNPLVTCGHCPACESGRSHLCPSRQILSMPPRPGAFADYVCVPEKNLVPIPDTLSIAHAALAEPLAVAYHAVNQGARLLGRPLAGARCVVLGGGAIGFGSGLILAMQGAADIAVIEPNPERRATAARGLPTARCHAPGDADGPGPNGADLVLDAVGSRATRAEASRIAGPGAVIVHIGLLPGEEGLDVRKITLQEIVVSGSYCYTMQEFRDVIGALADGRLGSLDWVEERPLAEGATAFADMDANRVAAPKLILSPEASR
ncbi:alcohol dehydrogenase catalytic domain-containing protein [Methylobacterium longum]|uniref:Alcohol dehydrogenase catalytic domain-containing protein n=1 Tax=Methylobacterium longum TaxID=767694 RepID=A0ABT8ARX1_9HYPH|nr:alcohol dehydrogenase catalytic domain-containing protein [Methylobacterium longum]MDN3572598.1 alcohol dehydrogenase catalytic domain-containing protein [Methylobacterium longum]GJE12674.1 2-dehydro-3-deoxy-L-rhamnonate dehydrogenase (NAD(+)) [Methylobacterium longum]